MVIVLSVVAWLIGVLLGAVIGMVIGNGITLWLDRRKAFHDPNPEIDPSVGFDTIWYLCSVPIWEMCISWVSPAYGARKAAQRNARLRAYSEERLQRFTTASRGRYLQYPMTAPH